MVLGSPETVRGGLEAVASEYGAEEVIVVTVTHSHAAREHSYGLIAEAFRLRAGPERKFDPARAARLDAPERDTYLPDAPLVALLELEGSETVLDYGAGTGRLAIAVRGALGEGGRVIAVEENEEMVGLLEERIAAAGAQVEVTPIADNRVPAPDGTIDRVLAVNLLHEVHGERALEEMRRLLRPGGLLLVADWERGRDPERALGPPDEILYSEDEAATELERAGFDVERHSGRRWHFALVGRPRA
jgi:SAM-dependent methyltransferase